MNRLLTLADFVCGEPARRRVFEPLLADWQRELQQARVAGAAGYTMAMLSGSFGFARAVISCAITDGIWMPPLHGALLSVAAVGAAIAASIGILLTAAPPNLAGGLSLPSVQLWVLTWAGSVVPPVFLLGTFMLRCDSRATHRHAIVSTVLAAFATTLLVVSTTDEALRRRYDTFETSERMRDFSLARHREGRLVYRGSAYQQELATTIEQRRARFVRYRAQMNAIRYEPPATMSSRLAQWRPVGMSVVFAAMGWLLAGLGSPTISRGIAWWALILAAIVAMTRLLSLLVGIPMPRPPEWAALPLFTAMMIALAIGARRNPQQQSWR
jgi:hypothetical protein